MFLVSGRDRAGDFGQDADEPNPGFSEHQMIGIARTGGEGGIRLPPSSASADEHYTSVIIACVCRGYKRIRS